jgi:hypothetical protein
MRKAILESRQTPERTFDWYLAQSQDSRTSVNWRILSGLRSRLAEIWQLLQFNQFSEVQIWQTTDRWGKIWWHVRDSAGRTATRSSEAEILEWIDSRYR